MKKCKNKHKNPRKNAKNSLLKLYSSDVGLLTYQYGNTLRSNILFDNEKVNLGGIYENFVAQQLNAHGYPSYFYNNHSLGELDFVIEHGGSVVPIEVKSGKDYYVHSAINKATYNEEYQIKEAYVFANCNIWIDGKITYFPVYICCFINDEYEYPILSIDIWVCGKRLIIDDEDNLYMMSGWTDSDRIIAFIDAVRNHENQFDIGLEAGELQEILRCEIVEENKEILIKDTQYVRTDDVKADE